MKTVQHYINSLITNEDSFENEKIWRWWEKKRWIFNVANVVMLIIPVIIHTLLKLGGMVFFGFIVEFFYLLSLNFLFFVMPLSDFLIVILLRQSNNLFRRKLFILSVIFSSITTLLIFSWFFIFNKL